MSSDAPKTFSDAPEHFPVQGAVHSDEPRPNAATATEPQPVTAETDPGIHARAMQIAGVDDSLRLPVLLFFLSALTWLVLGSTLSLFAVLKLNLPEILPDFAWLTVGRVIPAAAAAMTYGWAVSAGIGVGLWLLARLGRTPLLQGGVLLAAWLLWNLGVIIGTGAILYGQGTSVRALEFPRYVFPLLFSAFIFIGIWAILLFRQRETRATYISQWYALAAFLWFPWSYATAQVVVFYLPVQSAAKSITAAWYAHNLVMDFFVPLALAVAYYVIPKVTGQTIQRYGWAKFGFWTWLLFSSWAGTYDLIDGPVPAWISSVAVVATLLTLLPLFVITSNLLGTMSGCYGGVRHSPSLRFVVVGVCCFLAGDLAMVILGFRSVNEIAHFTLLTLAGGHLLMYGFVSFSLFGAIYYITPRMLGAEWMSTALIRSHFWYATVGLGLIVVSSAIGGTLQGLGLDDPKEPVLAILSLVKPFLASNLVATLLMLIGHVCLGASFALIILRIAYAALLRRPLVITGTAAPTDLAPLPVAASAAV